MPSSDIRPLAASALGGNRSGADIVLCVVGATDDLGPLPEGVLTQSTALCMAIQTDPKLQQALARVRGAEADAKQLRLLPNPVLALTVRFREGGGSPIITPIIAADLASLLSRPRQTSAADNLLRAACADALSATLDIVAQTRQAYTSAQSRDAQLVALRERMEAVRKMVGVANARLKAGEAARGDLLTLQAQQSTAELDLADRELDRQTDRLLLMRLIGQPSADIERPLEPLTEPAPLSASESAWVSAAMKHRPDIQARQWDLAALQDREALAAFFPWDKVDVGVEAERDQTWSLGPTIGLALPFFDTGIATRQAAFAKRIEARHKVTEVRRLAIEETRRAWRTYRVAQGSLVRVKTELLPLQTQRRDLFQKAYQAGEGDLVSYLLAQTDLNDTQQKWIELQRKAAAALADLERAAGGAGVAAETEGRPAGIP